MIKLIALDLDGTLLTREKNITPRTQQALARARAQGIEIVLASGRPTVGILPIWDKLQLNCAPNYMISFNGSLATHIPSDETLLSKGLVGSDAKLIKKEVDTIGLDIHAFSRSLGVITPKLNPYTGREAEVNGIGVTEFDFNLLEDDHELIKIMMVGEPNALTQGIAEVPQHLADSYTLVQSAPIFFEFLNPEVNKGIALAAITKHKGIKMNEVISFGDAGNDRAMLRMSGIGVAMGNADDETKSIADRVTLSHENDGIAVVIEEVLNNFQ